MGAIAIPDSNHTNVYINRLYRLYRLPLQERNGLNMGKVTFDIERCKGCGLCVRACPKKIVTLDNDKLNQKGYHPATVTDAEQCIACAFCATMCPDCVIKVEK